MLADFNDSFTSEPEINLIAVTYYFPVEFDLELVCMRKEGTSNIAFELTDCVNFVNHLSLLCNCIMLCYSLNIRSLSKTTLL